MAWSTGVYAAMLADTLNATASFDLNGSITVTAALFGDKTPDKTVTAANSAYGAGVWASGGVTDTGSSAPAGWPTIGLDLTVSTAAQSSNVYTFDCADRASANDVTTITAAYGTLVYQNTLASPVADQGISFHSFGGSQSVTLGRFTIVWNGSGLFTVTA